MFLWLDILCNFYLVYKFSLRLKLKCKAAESILGNVKQSNDAFSLWCLLKLSVQYFFGSLGKNFIIPPLLVVEARDIFFCVICFFVNTPAAEPLV